MCGTCVCAFKLLPKVLKKKAQRTGMKCLRESKVSLAQGRILHDSHAETLAIRCFNHYILDECENLVRNPSAISPFIVRQGERNSAALGSCHPFTIRPEVMISMYCSEAPCGDASMELIMVAQEDPTPWPLAPNEELANQALKGRGSFAELGVVRRKPARGDCPASLSKSCSDKMALKQCTSLLSSLASVIVSPRNAYLSSLIIPRSEYVHSAFERSFSTEGRMKLVAQSRWPGDFAFSSFHTLVTDQQFQYSKRSIKEISTCLKSSNICAIWNPHIQETLINGVLQGWKQSDPRCASSISRMRLVGKALAVYEVLENDRAGSTTAPFGTYQDFKNSELVRDRRRVKQDSIARALVGWVPNVQDSFPLSHK